MNIDEIHWIYHAGFYFESNNKRIFIDPFNLKKDFGKADIVFITHPHFDHLDANALEKIIKKDTIVVLPKSAMDQLKLGKPFPVEPNNRYELNDISFSTIPAYNIVKDRLQFHNRKNNWVGYIINLDIGKIYHAGDTDFVEEMKGLDVDLALIPIGGKYTMNLDEAIEAANSMKAKIVAPMHYKALLGKNGSEKAEKTFKEKVSNAIILSEEEEPDYSF